MYTVYALNFSLPYFEITPIFKLYVAIAFFTISAVLVFFSIKNALTQNGMITNRLAQSSGTGTANAEAPSKAHSLMMGFAQNITLPGSQEVSRLRYFLSQAGFFSPAAVQVFQAIRVLAVILPQIVLLTVLSLTRVDLSMTVLAFVAVSLALIGFKGPEMVVNHLKSRRTNICKNGFPDMMDLLIASVEAGLGLDAALMRVAVELERRYPPLKTGLDLMNLELRAGRSRHEALKNFADFLDLNEAKTLAVMLKQSEEMGSSLGEALRTFSEDMRSKRMLKAEEKALALSAKLTVPLIVFIFPTIMLMLLLPAGIRLAEGL